MTAANQGRGSGRALGMALVMMFGLAGVASAADESAVLLLKAEQLASEDRCAAALPVVREVRELDPQSARAALLEGECSIREQRYAEAIGSLEDARRLDPRLSRVALNLGIAHFQVGNKQEALDELDEAVRVMPDSAEAHLYRGLVLLDQADTAGAAAALEQARSLDPGHPAASYYAGRAFQMAEQREEAEAALERVIAEAPGTPWADEAARALEGSRSRTARRGFWGRMTAGMEYDSNVILLGEQVIPPTVGPDEEDGRGVWYGRVGSELYRDEKWAAGLLGGYYGSAHIDAKDFDAIFPTIAAWGDRQLGERTYLRFQPEFGYSWLDNDDYLLIASATPSLHHAYENAGNGRVFFRFEHRDYLFSTTQAAVFSGFGPAFAGAFNRDGQNYSGGYEHSYDLSSSTELRAAAGANYYDSEFGEYSYVAPAVGLGVLQGLPFDSTFDLDLLYRHEFYDNHSAFTNPLPFFRKREDDVVTVAASLEKRLTQNLLVSARYRYRNNESNVTVFDYDRHIVGGYLTVEFGSE